MELTEVPERLLQRRSGLAKVSFLMGMLSWTFPTLAFIEGMIVSSGMLEIIDIAVYGDISFYIMRTSFFASVIFCILSPFFGFGAIANINNENLGGKNMAKVGIYLGILGMIMLIGIFPSIRFTN